MKRFRLLEGEKLNRSPNKPILTITGGARAYLWIGNDAEEDKACFATLGGRAQLKRLASEILTALEKEQTN